MSSGFGMDARLGSLLQPIALSVLAFGLGYQVHSYTSRRTLSSTTSASIPKPTRSRSSSTSSNESHIEAEDSDSEAEDEKAALISDLTSVKATMLDEIKLVLVVNDSLKMSKGKIAAQAGHATLACAFMLNEVHPRLFSKWKRQGQPKIALRCSDTEELETLAAQARSLNLCARTIQDAGRTQVAAGSKTILGIGPGPARLINQITGKLKLL